MRFVGCLLAVSALLTSAPVVHVAWAHDHAAPDATLHASAGRQEGLRITSCWIKGKRVGGAALCRQEETSFPDPIDAGATATVAFETSREPKRVRIRAWRRLRMNGEPRPPARRLQGVVKQRPAGWRVAFETPVRTGTWFLEVKGVWADARFPESEQFALWTLSLHTR
jgi:hypothetical protein